MKRKLFLRVDGGLTIGLGHLIRCLSLAQMVKNEFQIHFFCIEIPDEIRKEIIALTFNVNHILTEDIFLDKLSGQELVVLDNYNFDSNYQKKVKSKGNKLICIDDLHHIEFYADLIINVSPTAKTNAYIAQSYTVFAFGIQYALLRPIFLKNSGPNKIIGMESKALISFGGSDTNNKTLETLKFVKNNFTGVINIVVGVSYPFLDDLKSYVDVNNLKKTVNIFYDIGERLLIELMRGSGIAICAPSTVSIEYLSVSKGTLLLSLTAENQKHWYNYAIAKKLAFEFSEVSFIEWQKLKTNYILQDELFDGRQKERFVELLVKL